MIGIICALNIEVEGLKQQMTEKQNREYARMMFTFGKIGGREVVAVECGIGKVNAAVCTQVMIDLYRPDVIINSGIAGSLRKDLRIGDIVVAEDVVQHDMDGTAMGDPPGEIWFNDEKKIEIAADEKVREQLYAACKPIQNTNVRMGRIATGDVFVADVDRRLQIGRQFQASACEMEGGAIGQVCYRNGVPFGILRSISDDLNQNEFVDFMEFRRLASEKSIDAIIRFLAASD